MTPVSTGASWPICATMSMANRNARIKLNTGPAAMTAMRDNTGLLLNAFGSGFSESSPTIMQEPPKGSALMEYRVSPFSTLKMRGPIPTENSTTPIPLHFASRKCPNSCTSTINPNSSTAARIFSTLPPAFYIFIGFPLSCKDRVHIRVFNNLVMLHGTLDHIYDGQIGNLTV